MSDKKSTKSDDANVVALAEADPPLQTEAVVDGQTATVTIDGAEFVLSTQELLALKKAIDAAVVGLCF